MILVHHVLSTRIIDLCLPCTWYFSFFLVIIWVGRYGPLNSSVWMLSTYGVAILRGVALLEEYYLCGSPIWGLKCTKYTQFGTQYPYDACKLRCRNLSSFSSIMPTLGCNASHHDNNGLKLLYCFSPSINFCHYKSCHSHGVSSQQ